MPDDPKTYTESDFNEAVEAEVEKRVKVEVQKRLTDARESEKLEKTYSEEQFNAEVQRRLDDLGRMGRRELVKRVQTRADVPYSEANRIAAKFFDRLTPKENGDLEIRLASGAKGTAGFTNDNGFGAIDQLAAEAVHAARRDSTPSQADIDAALSKKRRSSVFRSVL